MSGLLVELQSGGEQRGRHRILHPKKTGPSACLPKPLAGVPSGSTESDSDSHRKTPYWPLGLLPFPNPSG